MFGATILWFYYIDTNVKFVIYQNFHDEIVVWYKYEIFFHVEKRGQKLEYGCFSTNLDTLNTIRC